MPLTAQLASGVRVVAPDLSVREMSALRGTELAMPCCGSAASVVIPQDLLLRQKHFRHHRIRTEPANDWCDEFDNRSPAHIKLQELVYRLALEAGWGAEIEAWGPRRRWVADVLLTPPWAEGASNPKGRVAAEIQLSPQAPEEYLRRSRRYVDDGVRPLWLVGPGATPHLETEFTTGGLFAEIHEDLDGYLVAPLRSANNLSWRPLGQLMKLLDGTSRLRLNHRHAYSQTHVLPSRRPPSTTSAPVARSAPPRDLPTRRSAPIKVKPVWGQDDSRLSAGAIAPSCEVPREHAPGWFQVRLGSSRCEICKATYRTWQPVPCGETGHPCTHGHAGGGAAPSGWTVTLGLRSEVSRLRTTSSQVVATPTEAGGWACPNGHPLEIGDIERWHTFGVRLDSGTQLELF